MLPEALEAFATFMDLRARELNAANIHDSNERTKRDAKQVLLRIPPPPEDLHHDSEPKDA